MEIVNCTRRGLDFDNNDLQFVTKSEAIITSWSNCRMHGKLISQK